MSRAGRGAAALAAVLLVSFALFLPLCAVAHRCGCTWPWAGAEARCNVHAPAGPHCPWCEHPALGVAAAIGICGGQALVFRRLRRRGWSEAAAGLGAAASFVVVAPLVTALAWAPTDYPHLFLRDARARLGLPAGPVRCLAGGRRGATGCCAPATPSD